MRVEDGQSTRIAHVIWYVSKIDKKKRTQGSPELGVVNFACEGLGFVKDMTSELDFTYLLFLLSVTPYTSLSFPPSPLSKFQIIFYQRSPETAFTSHSLLISEVINFQSG